MRKSKFLRGSKMYNVAVQLESGDNEIPRKILKKMIDEGLINEERDRLTTEGKIRLFASKHNISVIGVHTLAYAYQKHIKSFGEHKANCPIDVSVIKRLCSMRQQNRIKMIISGMITQEFFIRRGYDHIVLNHKKLETFSQNEIDLFMKMKI